MAGGSQAGDLDYTSSVYIPQPSTSRTAAKARQDRLQQEQQAKQSQTRPKDDPPPVLDLSTLPPQALQRYLSRCKHKCSSLTAKTELENCAPVKSFASRARTHALSSRADGLLEPHGTLSYHHAVFPVPPLPANLTPPLNGRTLIQAKRPQFGTPSTTEQQDTNADPNTDNGPSAGDTTIIADPAHAPANMATTTSQAAQVQQQVNKGDQPAAVTVGKGRKRTWEEPHTKEFRDVTAYDHPQIVMDRLAQRAKVHWDQREGVKEG